MVGSDFNVEVGILTLSDPPYDPATRGKFGLTKRSPRDDWLMLFCEEKDLALASTFFEQHLEEYGIYINDRLENQLHFLTPKW